MNLKPFDLEKALAGAPVVTRNGKPVEQLVFMDKAAAGEMRLIGVIGEEVVTFTDKGEFNPVSDKPQSWDLFMAPEKREYWVGVCQKEGLTYYATGYSEDEVRKEAQAAKSKVLAVTKIHASTMTWFINIFRKTKADPYQMKERFGYIPTISKPKGRCNF